MNRQRILFVVLACEVLGLVLMLFVNRLFTDTLSLVVTGLGFLLVIAGPFIMLATRKT